MSHVKKLTLAIPVNDRDHAIGPIDASVIVVNYGDYECPDCHHTHREVEKMFDQLMNAVRFIYRHFPRVIAVCRTPNFKAVVTQQENKHIPRIGIVFCTQDSLSWHSGSPL